MYSEFQETTTSQKSNNSCGWGRRRKKLFVFPLYQASIVRQANKSDGWAMGGGRLLNFFLYQASIVQQQLTKVVGGQGEGEGYLFFFNIKHQ